MIKIVFTDTNLLFGKFLIFGLKWDTCQLLFWFSDAVYLLELQKVGFFVNF